MGRASFTPLIETTLDTFPTLKDNWKKLAQKVGCCTKTIKRYFENKGSKVPPDNNKDQAHANSSMNSDEVFIDDPNELLMSNAIRALNKEDPHVAWGTLLYNILKETKQLQAPSKERSEVQSKLKAYSTTDLISLRKKLTGNLQDAG